MVFVLSATISFVLIALLQNPAKSMSNWPGTLADSPPRKTDPPGTYIDDKFVENASNPLVCAEMRLFA